ncbi:MAG TPA: toll/interleukin-1 receptor domain-containing protein [Blastocatellia bacterium]|nr:toll/interleukin-1 receptor domain-containing protein [Blastocatellia bacterium]
MFEHDLFISYTHIDNETFDGSEEGWIDLLHKRLAIRLAQLLGDPARIWRDPKLQGNDYFGDTLLDKLAQVASIISILSPRYMKSEWCQRELREFYRQAVANGGVRFDDKSRIFKVIKTPIPRDEHPPELQPLLGYEFFAVDQATNRFREFSHETGPNRDKRYWDKLEDLAQDIKELIERLRDPQTPAVQPSGKTVYLAETTSDLIADRDRIRRELELNGHRVLPDRPLPLDQRLRDEVNDYLAASQLAVHLVGANYGIVPEGESKSIVELQQELGAARCGAAGFSQIVWMPQGLDSADERQQKFISALSNHWNLPAGAVLLQLKLEDLKTFIGEKLDPPPPPPEPRKAATGNGHLSPALVYLICDQPDYEAIRPLEDYLFERGFELFSMAEDADPSMHRQYLQECDAVLTYCGNTTDGWLQMKRMDLLKLSSDQRAKPMLAKGFYLGGPQTRGKERFKTQDGIVIRNFGAFSPASLAPFIEEIERAREARQ